MDSSQHSRKYGNVRSMQSDKRLKKIGYYNGTAMLSALAPYRKMLGFAGLGPAEIEDLVSEVSKELHDIRKHWYMGW